MDSFTLAKKRYQEFSFFNNKEVKPILVLNLANPVNPGGGARRGAKAQEEDLKDENGALLEESVIVAVITCAAPMLINGMEEMTDAQYRDMVFHRIVGVLKVAAYYGYQFLVLGAFGCGAFGNDARVVLDLFYKALKEFDFDSMSAKDILSHRFCGFGPLCQSIRFPRICPQLFKFFLNEDGVDKGT